MKRNVNVIQQGRLIRDMSRRLERMSQRGGFASTLVSTYFAPTGCLTLCNAGHPLPLLFRSKSGEWSVLQNAATSLPRTEAPDGVIDFSEYQQLTTKLEVGDMLLSFSNILTECRNGNGDILGIDGLLQRVRRLDTSRPDLLVDDLMSLLQDEHGDNSATEDATVLLCRATETKVAWQDNLLAPFRLLRAVSDETTIV